MESKLTTDLEKDLIVSYQRSGKKVQVFCDPYEILKKSQKKIGLTNHFNCK